MIPTRWNLFYRNRVTNVLMIGFQFSCENWLLVSKLIFGGQSSTFLYNFSQPNS